MCQACETFTTEGSRIINLDNDIDLGITSGIEQSACKIMWCSGQPGN